MHEILDRAIVETLHTQTPLKLLDRDLACETVISAVNADQPGGDPLQEWHAVVKMACRVVSSRCAYRHRERCSA